MLSPITQGNHPMTIQPINLPSAIAFSFNEARSHLGGVLFEAGVQWSASGLIGNSLVVQVSFEPKSTWANGIFENSRSAKFIVHDDNRELRQLTGWRVSKLRARKLKSFEHLCEVLVKWARENVNSPKA